MAHSHLWASVSLKICFHVALVPYVHTVQLCSMQRHETYRHNENKMSSTNLAALETDCNPQQDQCQAA